MSEQQDIPTSDRTYVICHMVSSLDGRIDGAFFGAEEMGLIREASNQIREKFQAQAVICGATTTAGFYADGFLPQMPANHCHLQRNDFIVPSRSCNFYVSIDPAGCIQWSKNVVERNNAPSSAVIEVLTESVSDDYLAYLRKRSISYIFAGETELDHGLLLKKLRHKFNIQKAVLCGGGVTNWGFLQAKAIDTLSLVVCPFVEGNRECATLFDRAPYAERTSPWSFRLENIQTLPNEGLWLIYRPQYQQQSC